MVAVSAKTAAPPVSLTLGGETDATPSAPSSDLLQVDQARVGGARLPAGVGQHPDQVLLQGARPVGLALEPPPLALEGGGVLLQRRGPLLERGSLRGEPRALRLRARRPAP